MATASPGDTIAKQVKARLQDLQALRGVFESHWQECGENFLPKRSDFTVQAAAGQKRTAKIYDGTPLQAARGLASAVDGLLKAEPWLHVEARDDSLEDDEECKTWIDEVEKRIHKAIYNPKARFRQASSEVDLDLVVFGTGPLYMGLAESRMHMAFRHYHLKDCFISENADGEIDTAYVMLHPTARQAEQAWGIGKLGPKVKEALSKESGGKPDKEKKFDFVWAVEPRRERDPAKKDNKNMPFRSVIIGCDDENVVLEEGFRKFPFAIPRWETSADEVYGRAPAMLALADAKSLQAVAKTTLRSGQMAVDPPLGVISNAVLSPVRTGAGKLTTIDPSVLALYPGMKAIEPLITGAQPKLGMEFQEALKLAIWDAMYRNILQLPVNAPQMTATEVLERMKEFVRLLGPVFGRLEADYLSPIAECVYDWLEFLGLLPPMPDKLKVSGIRFTFSSAMQQARKQVEAGGAARAFEFMSAVAQFDPGVWDNYDGDKIARDNDTVFGMPRAWLMDVKQRDNIRGLRQQQKQMAEMTQMAAMAAQAAPKVAQAEKVGREAMMLPAPGTAQPQAAA